MTSCFVVDGYQSLEAELSFCFDGRRRLSQYVPQKRPCIFIKPHGVTTPNPAQLIQAALWTLQHFQNPSRWNKQTNRTVRCAAFGCRGAPRRAVLFPRTTRYRGAGDEFGSLVPLSWVVIHFISFTGKLKMEWKKKETETHWCAATVLPRTEQRWDRHNNQCNISVCIHASLHFWRKLKWFSENTQFLEQELSCSFVRWLLCCTEFTRLCDGRILLRSIVSELKLAER